MDVETVKIVADNEQGFVIINKSDLTPEHEIYDESKPEDAKPKRQRQKTESGSE